MAVLEINSGVVSRCLLHFLKFKVVLILYWLLYQGSRAPCPIYPIIYPWIHAFSKGISVVNTTASTGIWTLPANFIFSVPLLHHPHIPLTKVKIIHLYPPFVWTLIDRKYQQNPFSILKKKKNWDQKIKFQRKREKMTENKFMHDILEAHKCINCMCTWKTCPISITF